MNALQETGVNEAQMWVYIERALVNSIENVRRGDDLRQLRAAANLLTVAMNYDKAEDEEQDEEALREGTATKDVKQRAREIMRQTVKKHVDEAMEGIDSQGNMIVDVATDLLMDLKCVHDEMESLLPDFVSPTSLLCEEIDTQVVPQVVNKTHLNETKNGLRALDWLTLYRDFVQSNCPPERQEKSLELLNQPLEKSFENYAHAARERLDTWVADFRKTQGSQSLECDSKGALRSSGPELWFQALSEEIRVLDAYEFKVDLLPVLCNEAIFPVLNALAQDANQQYLPGDPKEDDPISNLCATMNDFERMYDHFEDRFIPDILAVLESKPELKQRVKDEADKVAVMFVKAIQMCRRDVSAVIIEQLAVVSVNLFSQAWVTGNSAVALIIVHTCRDFFTDEEAGLQKWLQSRTLVGQTVRSTMEAIIRIYVHHFLRVNRPFLNKNAVVARIRSDRELLVNFFADFAEPLRLAAIADVLSLESRFRALGLLADALESSTPETLFPEINREFAPFGAVVMHRIINFREDIPRSHRRKIKKKLIPSFRSSQSSESSQLSESLYVESPRFDASDLPRVKRFRARFQRRVFTVLTCSCSCTSPPKPPSSSKSRQDMEAFEPENNQGLQVA